MCPPDLKSPYSHQYTFPWEPLQGKPWSLQLGYIGSRTHKLFMMWFANRAVPDAGRPANHRHHHRSGVPIRATSNCARQGTPRTRTSTPRALPLKPPSWHGITGDASYWFSKAIDTGSAYTNMAAGDEALSGILAIAGSRGEGSQRPQRIRSVARRDGAVPVSRRRCCFTAAAVRSRRPLNGWRVSGIFLAKTGLPFSVITGSDGPGSGNVDGTTAIVRICWTQRARPLDRRPGHLALRCCRARRSATSRPPDRAATSASTLSAGAASAT